MLNHSMITTDLLKTMARSVERAIGRTSATQDIVQDAIVRMLANAESFDAERGSVQSWACRIASNTARNWRKASANNGHDSRAKTGKESETGERESADLIATMVGADGRQDAERAADAEALSEALATLADDERVFVRAINQGMGQTEAGALVGWSPATSTRRRKAIAAKLAPMF